MRLATYNVEWFANLFDDKDRLVVDDTWSGRQDVTKAQQIEALGIVFTALNADAIMIIEAPNTGRRQNTVKALEQAHWKVSGPELIPMVRPFWPSPTSSVMLQMKPNVL